MEQLLIAIVLNCWPFLLGMGVLLLIILFYTKKAKTKSTAEKKELLLKIEALKKQLSTQAIAMAQKKEAAGLNKLKIEKAINAKLGASAWQILELIYENPAISNKEIAEEISLSVEGVSSSLRRMYISFAIEVSNNKRIALIMKAARLSEETFVE